MLSNIARLKSGVFQLLFTLWVKLVHVVHLNLCKSPDIIIIHYVNLGCIINFGKKVFFHSPVSGRFQNKLAYPTFDIYAIIKSCKC